MGIQICPNMSPQLSMSIAALLLAVSVTNALPLGEANIVDVAVATPDLSTLVTALKIGKLVKALSGPGPFTVFAPSNEAFNKLPASALASLFDPDNIKELDALLEYHVVAGTAIHLKDFKNFPLIKTLAGAELTIRALNNTVFVNDAQVVNGRADIPASNGVIHFIDSVLMPSPAPAPAKPLLSNFIDRPDLSLFIRALRDSGLIAVFDPDVVSVVSRSVFAPSNQAWAQFLSLYPLMLELTNVELLQQLLKYHFVRHSVFSKDIKDNERIATEAGPNIIGHISPSVSSGLKINDAVVIAKDIAATDGVLHVVDEVLKLPNFPPPGNYTFPYAHDTPN